MTVATITALDYQQIFQAECARAYPAIDAFERRHGHAINTVKLCAAARILACPLKAHDPNWQHGRVLYSVARTYLHERTDVVRLLDIGTAKGFSALCLQWALMDSGADGKVVSIDVQHPQSDKPRNSVVDLDGLHTLYDYLEPWPEAAYIDFQHSSGIDWLTSHRDRIHLAFIDGKHTEDVVSQEGALLAERQQSGDVAIVDDVQITGVERALKGLHTSYRFEVVAPRQERVYAIGTRL